MTDEVFEYFESCRQGCYNLYVKDSYAWVEIPDGIPFEEWDNFMKNVAIELERLTDGSPAKDFIRDEIVNIAVSKCTSLHNG